MHDWTPNYCGCGKRERDTTTSSQPSLARRLPNSPSPLAELLHQRIRHSTLRLFYLRKAVVYPVPQKPFGIGRSHPAQLPGHHVICSSWLGCVWARDEHLHLHLLSGVPQSFRARQQYQ
ncbi:hypothetical protein N7470_007714 [Penicillium chermesinum]|nr:hypothetical protein N7470_007714 [Penicillium chermesinum]